MRRLFVYCLTAVIVSSLLAAGCETPWLQKIREIAALRPTLHRSPHRVALLEEGHQALLYRLELVREARRSIRIQTFIWSDEPTARTLLRALVAAAQRGVVVEILSDGLLTDEGSRTRLAEATANENFHARLYQPVAAPSVANAPYLLGKALIDWRGLNQRMHNKLMTVDDEIGIVGGRNVADEYFDRGSKLNFLDLDLVVEGRAVLDMVENFAQYWETASSLKLPKWKREEQVENGPSDDPPSAEYSPSAAPLRWWDVERVGFWGDLPGKPEPESHKQSLAPRLAALLSDATEEVLIQSPYFILSPRAQELFSHLHGKGVILRASTNSLAATDNWLTYAHSLRQRRTALRDLGFEIQEMKPFPDDLARYIPEHQALRKRTRDTESGPRLCLHSKALVIDGQTALVGSYNLDPRSAILDTESGVIVRDSAFAEALRQKIERDMAPGNSWTVARKQRLLPLRVLSEVVEEVNDIARSATTLDIWPLRYSALFELRPGLSPVAPGESRFYDHYEDVGLFPGVDQLDFRRILVELTRMLSGTVEPLL